MVDLAAFLGLAAQSPDGEVDPIPVFAYTDPIPAANDLQLTATNGAERLDVTPEEKPVGSSTGLPLSIGAVLLVQ